MTKPLAIQHSRLGLKISHPTMGQAAIGYALVQHTVKMPQDRIEGDPYDLIIRDFPKGETVPIIGYHDAESFSGSCAFQEGMTWRAHTNMILALKARLIEAGRPVSIKWVRAKDEV